MKISCSGNYHNLTLKKQHKFPDRELIGAEGQIHKKMTRTGIFIEIVTSKTGRSLNYRKGSQETNSSCVSSLIYVLLNLDNPLFSISNWDAENSIEDQCNFIENLGGLFDVF